MIRFEWDESKAAANLTKHGLSFEEAVEVFRDPYAVTEMDIVDHGELRWRTTGMVFGTLVVLFVAHTLEEYDDEEVIRIISARRADRKEAEAYGKNRKSHTG